MLAVVIGLAGALIFGSADFIGGVASKRIDSRDGARRAGRARRAPRRAARDRRHVVEPGRAARRDFGCERIARHRAALRLPRDRPHEHLFPLTAVVSALVPMLAGVVRGERLHSMAYIALVLALVAVVLVGFVPEKGAVRPSLKALAMAVASGALIGVFLIVIDLTPADSGLVPLVVNRAVNATVMFSVVAIIRLVGRSCSRRPVTDGRVLTIDRGWRPGLVLAIVGGVMDATANVLLLLGLRLGELTVQSVLTALYPAGTIILAAV